MGALEGKTALVTGGGSGIGYAIVERFIDEGAKVGVLDISRENLSGLKNTFDDQIVTTHGDVTSMADNKQAVENTVDHFSSVDVLIGNAGIYDNQISLEEIPEDELNDAFDELFSVNVYGYLASAKATLPELQDTGGCMVFTASYSSFNPAGGGALYVPSKHAVAGLIKQLAHELAPDIRVNGVAPGFVPSSLHGLASLDQGEYNLPKDKVENPLNIVPSPEAYTGYYVLLASEEGKPTTGSIINTDAGLSVAGHR